MLLFEFPMLEHSHYLAALHEFFVHTTKNKMCHDQASPIKAIVIRIFLLFLCMSTCDSPLKSLILAWARDLWIWKMAFFSFFLYCYFLFLRLVWPLIKPIFTWNRSESSVHKRGIWPIVFRWIQTPGFRCSTAYKGSKFFYSSKTAQKSAIFDEFWVLLDKKWIRNCLELVASPIFFLYSVPTQNVVLNMN